MYFFYIGCVPKESIIISATYSTLIAFSSPNSPLFGKVTVRLKNPAKSCLSGLWPSKCILKRTKQFSSRLNINKEIFISFRNIKLYTH